MAWSSPPAAGGSESVEILETDLRLVVGGNRSVPVPAEAGEVPFRVVFDNEAVIVVDKPPGVVVHPDGAHRSGTLVSGLLAMYPELARLPELGYGEIDRPGIVHRLDKDTSGSARRRPYPRRLSLAHRPIGGAHGSADVSGPCMRCTRRGGRRCGRADRQVAARSDADGGRRRRSGRAHALPGAGSVRRAPGGDAISSCGSRPAARTRSACTLQR